MTKLPYNEKEKIMPFEIMTKVEGPTIRHLEALWAEIKSLKERVEKLEEEKKYGKD